MQAMKYFPLAVALALTALLTVGIPSAAAAPAAPALPGAPAAPGAQQGNCQYEFQPPDSWVLVCQNGGGSPGGPGSGGGGAHQKVACTLVPLSKSQIWFLRLPPAPKGEKWAAITCPGTVPFNGVTLESGNGTPAVTPQELLQVAEGEMRVPVLRPGTAPPLGKDGLVGLPEWFWVPRAQWHPVTVTVAAGPVWAEVIAAPQRLTFAPGGGLSGPSCAGPGAQYRPRVAPSAQHTACSYRYLESSALQPGGAYAASVTVTWLVTWTGSGGVGGTINPGLQVAFPVSVPVAEGQALVTNR
jgi:hypothetical protein